MPPKDGSKPWWWRRRREAPRASKSASRQWYTPSPDIPRNGYLRNTCVSFQVRVHHSLWAGPTRPLLILDTLLAWGIFQLSGLLSLSISAGTLEPLALTQSSLSALSLVPNSTSCALAEEDKAQSAWVLCYLNQSFRCQAPFQIRDMFHHYSLPSSWLPVCHQLAVPVLHKAPGVFHIGHIVGCSASSSTVAPFTSSIQTSSLVPYCKHPAPCPSVLLLTIMDYSYDVFNGTVGERSPKFRTIFVTAMTVAHLPPNKWGRMGKNPTCKIQFNHQHDRIADRPSWNECNWSTLPFYGRKLCSTLWLLLRLY